MSDDSPAGDSNDTQWLLHHWVTAGIVSASARFIPIPFVDDLVQERCRRRIVSKTLLAHGQQDRLAEFESYFDDSNSGCLAGCLATVAKVPLKLLLFPVRKLIAIVTSVRGVPLEVTRSILLGRTLNRILTQGQTPTAADAAEMRSAFNEAFARMDLHAVRAVIGDALRHVTSWKAPAIASARALAQGDDDSAADIAAAEIAAADQVQPGATEVQAALQQPEILALFDAFDERFDRALDRIRRGRPTA